MDAIIFSEIISYQIPWYLISSIAALLFNIFTNKGIPIAVSVQLLHKPQIGGIYVIEGYKAYNINHYIEINKNDLNDFDEIINSEDSLILIKRYSSEKEIEENWKQQMYFVGGYIQGKFDMLNLPKSCLWNTYIIYLVSFDVPIDLKITIETDKFCCKKYIVKVNTEINESESIIKELPALTSLCIGSDIGEIISDELTIKNLFVNTGDIDQKIKNYFLIKEDYITKPINIVVDEMVGLFDEN